MARDGKRINRFRKREAYINGILSLFERAGFSVENVYDSEPDRRSWGAHIRPNGDLAQDLGLSHQLLLWVDNYEKFQPRSLERVRQAMIDNRPKLREDIAFLVSKDDDVADAVASLFSESTIIALSINKLRQYKEPNGPNFKRYILSSVFARDPYNLTGAVTHAWQLFGRTSLVSELITSVNNGHKVGLFGLRKIGKTSVLLRLLDQVQRSAPGIIAAHLQVARVDAINRTAPYFFWALGQSIFLSFSQKDSKKDFRLLGKYEVFSDIPLDIIPHIPDLFYSDTTRILRESSLKICLVLDEIERMWPTASNDKEVSQWMIEFPRIWQLLRSLDQEYPGKVSLIAAGTNPRCIESPKIGPNENPLFQYIQIKYLPFLDQKDAFTLLKDLGARAGLKWDDAACRAAYEQVSGHPALLRVLGSAIYNSGKNYERHRLVNEDLAREMTTLVVQNSTPILAEICGSVKEAYPDDYLLLEILAQNKYGEFNQYSNSFPDAVKHLIGFGLINSKKTSISFALLQTHLQSQNSTKLIVSTEQVPSQIGPYRIISSLGKAGGFGSVFTAQDIRKEDSDIVAIKILQSSSLGALNREVDILKDLNHPNIVKFNEAGTYQNKNYIVMEALEGNTWSSYCIRSHRMPSKLAKEYLIQLLKALSYLHPKKERKGDSTSIQDILLRRHGYIHRDIKPGNIIQVQKRGPVLIDFGISSRAGDPTKTTTSTPGYLPPDFIYGQWDADVDLYQLGLTVLQILVGDVLDNTPAKISNLRDILREDHDIEKRLRSCTLRLCAPSRGDRFSTATEALSSL